MIGRRLLWSAGAGCVAVLVWLVVAAGLGDDLGGPTGALVGFALVAIVGLVLAKRRDPLEPWIWSHGAKASEDFPAERPPVDVTRAAAAVAERRRGWRLTAHESDPARVRITASMTSLTWAKRIEVVVRPEGQRSLVTVTSASPQLIDWGDNKRAVALLRREIQGGSQKRP